MSLKGTDCLVSAFLFYLMKYSIHVWSAALCTVVTEADTVPAAPKAPPAGRSLICISNKTVCSNIFVGTHSFFLYSLATLSTFHMLYPD